jgi:hypothetical protein
LSFLCTLAKEKGTLLSCESVIVCTIQILPKWNYQQRNARYIIFFDRFVPAQQFMDFNTVLTPKQDEVIYYNSQVIL